MFAPIFAISIVPLMLAGGAGFDIANATRTKDRLQKALDAAVIAGASDKAAAEATARSMFAANFAASKASGSPQVGFGYEGPNVFAGTASLELPTMVMSMVGLNSISLEAVAKAAFEQPKPICIHVSDAPGAPAQFIIGANTVFDLEGCIGVIESEFPDSTDIAPTAEVDMTDLCQAGAKKEHEGPGDQDSPKGCGSTGGVTLPDPPPASSACDFVNFNVPNGTTNGQVSPGTYCGDTHIHNTNSVLEPGTYVVKGGTFTMVGTRVWSADGGVTFVLQGNNAKLDLRPDTDLILQASETGDYAGYLVFADPASTNTEVLLQSQSWYWLEGTIYAPGAPVTINVDYVHPSFPAGREGNIPKFTVVSNRFEVADGADYTHQASEHTALPDTSPVATLIE
ncbi:MAG: Tad domain-containing protein [Pseudomonadota bacterium]